MKRKPKAKSKAKRPTKTLPVLPVHPTAVEPPCPHHWIYEHTIYQGRGGEECAVHRQCALCGLHQMAYTTIFSKPLQIYELTDLRGDARLVPA